MYVVEIRQLVGNDVIVTPANYASRLSNFLLKYAALWCKTMPH